MYEFYKAFIRQGTCNHLHLFAINCKVVKLRLSHHVHELGLTPDYLYVILSEFAKIMINLSTVAGA